MCGRDCASLRYLFRAGVDHADAALIIDVRKLCHCEK
jgi:hypothetical protein